jgi:hypothetical protein
MKLKKNLLLWNYWANLVKLSSAVGAILVEGPNRLTYFWKRTIQWLFHQHLVLIEQMVSDKKIFMIFSSETTGPIATKLSWNSLWMAPFQNCVRWSWLPTKMVAKLKIESDKKIIMGISHRVLWQPSWLKVWNAGHNFGRGPPNVHFSKVWLRLAE